MSQNQNSIIPVDTQIDSILEENEPQVTPTETTSLLENAEPFRRYSHFPSNDSNKRHTWNPSHIRKLTAPITHYKRRSGFYDEDKHELVREGGGIRVWYDDYTTIDWIHDYIKERVRVRKLYSRKGFSGWVIKSWDGLQGWILVFLIGVVVACVAGIVDVTAEWGSDLKDGYCSNGITLKKHFCCENQKLESCAEWVEWSSAFKMEDSKKSAWFNYFAYVFVAFCFAVGSALLVKHNSLYASPSSKRSIRSNNNSQKSRQPKPYASGSVDTQIDSILEENEPQVTPTETTSLLENAEPFRRYSHFPSNDSNKRHTWNPSHIRKLTAPITHYKRRSGFYDEDKHELVREGGGIRVWYDDYTTIDWIHDYIKERVRVRKLYSRKGFSGWVIKSWDGLQGWILVFLIGVVVACVAGIVDVTAEWGSDLKDGYCSNGITLKKHFCCENQKLESCAEWVEWSSAFKMEDSKKSAWFNYFAYVFVAFCFAVGSALLVKHNSLYASPSSKRSIRSNNNSQKSRQPKPYASGSGIPEVKTILSGFVIRGFLGIRTLWVKAIALAMAVSSGMTLGKEGPFVHIACCVGNVISRLFHKYNKNEGKRREILSASAAAGVSVAFAAPIGGVLFSLEEVSYYFPSKTLCRSFFCAIVAAVSLKLIDPFGTGKIVMFQVKYDKDWHFFEIGSFLILGILGGLFGALLCKCIILYTKYVRT
ncbi:20834_t:CDS:10, partial [Entrophospora sp. SA101]